MRQILLFLLVPIFSIAQIPTYYDPVDFSASPSRIKAQLAQLIETTHINQLTYTPDIWDALMLTDVDPNDPQSVLLLYGSNDNDDIVRNDRSRLISYRCNFSGNCQGYWNREHVFARSLGTPNLGFENAGSDAHALRPCDSEMNSWRSNRVFADASGDAQITPQGHFYPGDEWKGDVARMLMYMYLRYPNQCLPYNTIYSPNDNGSEMPSILLDWNAQDPPSQNEILRNDILENDFQGNRNPFIDNPYLATFIWGGIQAMDYWNMLSSQENLETTISLYPNPTEDCVYYNLNELTSINVYNQVGQLVYKDKTLSDNKTKLPSVKGLYYLELCNAVSCKKIKVIKK